MHPLTLRWTLWGSLFAYAAFGMVGLSRFLMPTYETVPLEGIARSPASIEYFSYRPSNSYDDWLAFEREGQAAVFAKRKELGRRGWFVAVVGTVGDFPVPSVTYLARIDVYLVRTQAGFTAIWGRDADRGHALLWVADGGYFHEPRRGTTHTMTGQCQSGPCFNDLALYAVEIDGDTVLVNVHTRVIRSRFHQYG